MKLQKGKPINPRHINLYKTLTKPSESLCQYCKDRLFAYSQFLNRMVISIHMQKLADYDPRINRLVVEYEIQSMSTSTRS